MLDIDQLDSPSQYDSSQHVASNDSNQFSTNFNSDRGHAPSLNGIPITGYNFPDSPTLGATQNTTVTTNGIEPLEISINNPWLYQESNWSLPLQSSQISHLDLNLERSETPTPPVDLHAEDQLHLVGHSNHRFKNTPSVSSKPRDSILVQGTSLAHHNLHSISENGQSINEDTDSGFYSMNVVDCNSFPERSKNPSSLAADADSGFHSMTAGDCNSILGQGLGDPERGGDMSFYSFNMDISGSASSNSHIPNEVEDQHSDSNNSVATACVDPGTLREPGFTKTPSVLYRIYCDKDHRNVALGLIGACDCGITKVHAICICATSLPHYEAVRILATISNKDELDGVGNTSLHYLAAAGSKRLLQHMLSYGVDVKRLNTFGQNFLHVLDASSFGDELIDFLDSFRGYGLLDQRDHDGRTVLHGLLRYPINLSVCRELLTFYGHSGAFQFALRDSQGRNAAHYLDFARQQYPFVLYDHAEYIETTLCFKNTARSLIVWAEALDDTTKRKPPDKDEECAVAVLNKASSVPNSENWNGSNALHCLAFWPVGHSPDIGQFRVNHMKQYISCGVDLNSYDQAGRTPLLAHLHESQPADDESAILSIVKLLVQNGANVHSRDRNGHTAIYHAIVKGFSGCVSFLLQNGACANSRVKDGRSLRKIAQEALQLQLGADDQAGSERLKKCLAILQDLIAYSAVLEPTPLQEWGVESIVRGSGHVVLTP